jgi:hypothetical protein
MRPRRSLTKERTVAWSRLETSALRKGMSLVRRVSEISFWSRSS